MIETRHVTAVLAVRPMLRGSETAVVEAVLGRRPGVERVEANAVAQTATVTYDPALLSLADLRQTVEECGYHCGGQSVPAHVCDPRMEPRLLEGGDEAKVTTPGHEGHEPSSLRSPREVMGHGGPG